MTTLDLPSQLRDCYELLADELDGFDDADELVRYVLESTAAELERDDGDASDDDRPERADDGVVEDRLERLGYLEK